MPSLALLLLVPALAFQDTRASRPAAGPRLLVLNKSDGTASFHDPATGTDEGAVAVGQGPHEAATSPDGSLAVVCNYGAQKPGNSLSVIDLKTRKVTRTITLEHLRPHGIAFLTDGKRIAVTSETSRRLLLLDLAGDKLAAAIETGAETSHMVALSPDGKRGYTANIKSGSISVLDLVKGELLKVIPTGAGAEGIAVHPTRPEVWVTNRAADTVSVVDTDQLEVVKSLPCAKFPIRVAFTPNGASALVTCAMSGDLAVFDTRTRELARRVEFGKATLSPEAMAERTFGQFGDSPTPVGVLVAADGRTACVALTNQDEVAVVDLGTWKELRRIKTGHQPDGMTWLPAPAAAAR